MIKAPFCFDVEYFSIVVLYAFSPSPTLYYFRDQREKDAYISSLAKNSSLSPKEIKDIDRQNFYYDTTQSTPVLYIIVQNTINKECFCSANKEEDLPIEIKAIFQDLSSLYYFVRQNCNNDRIKLTKNGNMILQYTIEQTVHQLKLENYPIQLPTQSIEDIWQSFKQAWQHRKDQDYKEPFEGFYHKVKKSHISMHGISKQRTPNPYLPSQELSAEDHNIYGDQQRKMNSKGPRLVQTVRTVQRRPRRDDSYESQENSRDWQSRERGYRKLRDRSPRSYGTAKVKTILKQYPEDYYQSQRRKTAKLRSRRQVDYRRGRDRRSQPQQSNQSEGDRRNQRGQPLFKKIQQVLEAIKSLRNQVEEIRKNTSSFASIQRTFAEKVQLFTSAIKKEVGTINSNLYKFSQGSRQRNQALEFVDQDSKNAYLMFYAQKMPHFREHFQLADSSKVEDYLKDLWSALGPKQKSSYFNQMKSEDNSRHKKIKKSSKAQQQEKKAEINKYHQQVVERSSVDEGIRINTRLAEDKRFSEEDNSVNSQEDESDNEQ